MFDATATTRPRRSSGYQLAFSSRRTRIDCGRRLGHAWPAVTAPLLIAGCGVAPSVNILGSFFPAWLFCIVIGIVLTIVSLRVFVAFEIAPDLGPPTVVYPCLAGAWIFATWLLVFGG